jgi:Ca-activated chloride channel family protein
MMIKGLLTGLVLALLLGNAPAQSASADRADMTLAPYFVVAGSEPGVDALPLKTTDVDIKVSGVIADVRITQVYRNEGAQPIEARYLFPASTRAAVYAMRMRVGDRVVEAQIREKQTARREYETAKREGKSASLLEQQRPNVFQMSIANVMPGDEIAVDLRYTETVVPVDGIYRFVFRPSSAPVTTARPARRATRPSAGSHSRRCAPGRRRGIRSACAPRSTARSPCRTCARHRTGSRSTDWARAARTLCSPPRPNTRTATSFSSTGWRARRSLPVCCCTRARTKISSSR